MNNRQKNYRLKIGVLTSGGDAPAMNDAVRAIVRSALQKKVDIYGIFDGYEGMIKGGNKICKLKWEDAGNIISRGGTVLGSRRCLDFQEWEGRLKAAEDIKAGTG
jgi:6-phosphofructokinase 1